MNEWCEVLVENAEKGTEELWQKRGQCHVLRHKCPVKQSGTEAERSLSEAFNCGIPVKDTAWCRAHMPTFQMALHPAFETSAFVSYIFSLQIQHIYPEEGDSIFYR